MAVIVSRTEKWWNEKSDGQRLGMSTAAFVVALAVAALGIWGMAQSSTGKGDADLKVFIPSIGASIVGLGVAYTAFLGMRRNYTRMWLQAAYQQLGQD
jgi:hypothetical protein